MRYQVGSFAGEETTSLDERRRTRGGSGWMFMSSPSANGSLMTSMLLDAVAVELGSETI